MVLAQQRNSASKRSIKLLMGTLISQLRDVTCHMGSHSVTCHPTQVNMPAFTPASKLVLDVCNDNIMFNAHLVCYIIDDNDAMCTAVVAGSDGAESLLTRRVPL